MGDANADHDVIAAMFDAVAMFEELGIGYALAGCLAAGHYGRARITEDADFIAVSEHEQDLAAHPDAMRKHRFDPSYTWKFHHDSGAQIDLWKDEHVDGIVSRARPMAIAGRVVMTAEPHDLIAMKLRANRLRDDGDIGEILAHASIDDATIRRRVTAEQYEHYLQIKRRAGR